MSTSPTQPTGMKSNRRLILVVVAIAAISLIVILALVAAWLFFFGSEAPEAPTLDNALKVLLPSATPE